MVARQEHQTRTPGPPGVSDLSTSNSGTTAVREGYDIDESALGAWMAVNIAGYDGPLRVEQFRGGQSNPTYKLVTPGKSYVLRRKPSGQLLKGAHAIEREVRVIQALDGIGFPVAHVHGLCTDDSVIGTWFYVMDMVEGRVFWNTTLPDMAAAERPLYFDAMNATLAGLHRANHGSIGLGDYGRPGNYFARQIKRWTQQYLDDREAGRDPHMDRLIAWLPDNIPDDRERSSIVHGDYRMDNMIFHPSEPRVLAVLDWELSTIGHPFADFSYNAMVYRLPAHIVSGLAGADLEALNIPSEAQYLQAYCDRLGIETMPGYDFYIAFNLFRLAAIFHGIKGRAIRGTASSAEARERVKMLPELMEIGWREARKAAAS